MRDEIKKIKTLLTSRSKEDLELGIKLAMMIMTDEEMFELFPSERTRYIVNYFYINARPYDVGWYVRGNLTLRLCYGYIVALDINYAKDQLLWPKMKSTYYDKSGEAKIHDNG